MRFFSGTRDGSKKGIASALYKQKLSGRKEPELTPQQKYEKVLEAKLDNMMLELASGKKSAFRLPGTKDPAKKEVSKHFKATIEEMARRKAMKALKAQQRKERSQDLARRDKLRYENNAKAREAAAKQAADKAAQTQQTGYFFGTIENDNGGWSW